MSEQSEIKNDKNIESKQEDKTKEVVTSPSKSDADSKNTTENSKQEAAVTAPSAANDQKNNGSPATPSDDASADNDSALTTDSPPTGLPGIDSDEEEIEEELEEEIEEESYWILKISKDKILLGLLALVVLSVIAYFVFFKK